MPKRLRPLPLAVTSLLAAALLTGCGSETSDSSGTAGAPPAQSTDEATGSCSYPADGQAAKEVAAPPTTPATDGPSTAVITLGTSAISLTLTPERTPCTVNSFVSLAEQGWFDGTECHRLTTQGIYVLQCGDPTATGTGGPGYTIPDEVDGTETYPAGTVAMAKTPAPDSGGSQFFLVYDDTPLPPEYTVFGTVDDAGVEALQEVAAAGTADGGSDGPPASPVTIEKVALG